MLMFNPKWTVADHTALLDQALVYLDMRKAPVSWLRAHFIETSRPILDDLDDDEWVPFTRLAVQEPPRHGKSEHISRGFSAWYLGRHPDHHVILTSYGDNYAATWGRKARAVLETVGQRAFGLTVSRRTSAANDWEIEGHTGGMNTAGVGGAITGRGANCLIVDDPVKDAKDAASPVIQESTWDWWQSTAYTRLETDENGLEPIALIIQTRWNEGDLTGRILVGEEDVEDDETWFILKLPAIAEANDPLGRAVGEPLWPQRRSMSFLARIKERVGSYWWSALYQQRPTPDAGNIILREWWQTYTELPQMLTNRGIFIDTAHDEKTEADFSIIAPIARAGVNLYWDRDVRQGKWQFPELIAHVRDISRTHPGWPIVIEDTPGSKALQQSLEREGFGVVPWKHGGISKLPWVHATTPVIEAGNCYLPSGAAWVPGFIDEHAAFPNGAHDDYVTTTYMGISYLASRAGVTVTQPNRPKVLRAPANGWRRV